ncbi:MAG: prepilin-type N-terminal cleavage/methylation domain-containing protein [Opitutaceae bacterium]|jgi:general secretion pathway protein G
MKFSSPSPRSRFRAGFTLVELLTVIAIVGILVAIMIPVVGTMRERARDSKCKSNLKQLITAYLLYSQDNRGKVVNDTWPQQLESYMVRLNRSTNQTMYEMFACPSVFREPTDTAFSMYNSTYAANVHGAVYTTVYGFPRAPTMLNAIANPGRVFVFADWLPGWRKAEKYDFWRLDDPVSGKEKTFRHNGKVNAVFVDGHIEQIASPFPRDVNAAPWN